MKRVLDWRREKRPIEKNSLKTHTYSYLTMKHNEERLGFSITNAWSTDHPYWKQKVFFISTLHYKCKSCAMGLQSKV